MPNLTSVTLTNGIPSAGNGNVSTIDNMLGTAGTPSLNPITVQGITSGQPLITTISTGTVSLSPAPNANGQALKSASAPVTLPLDYGPAQPTSNFNRPNNATTYAGGQLVSNSTTAGSCVPMSFTLGSTPSTRAFIRGAKLFKSATSTANAQFRLHLYGTSPTPSNGDGAAWLTGSSQYLGDIDINLSTSPARVFTDGVVGYGVPNASRPDIAVQINSGQVIYGLVEVTAAYVPTTSETITVTLDAYQS